jgi:hypothetical protein
MFVDLISISLVPKFRQHESSANGLRKMFGDLIKQLAAERGDRTRSGKLGEGDV